jgi:transcriptional regulator with XRE-family HTH domain
MDIYSQLGKRIIYLRKQRKMSQLQLALDSEINKNYISDLERGKRNPSLMILNKIAIALNIDMSELLKGIQDFSYEDIVLKMSSIK